MKIRAIIGSNATRMMVACLSACAFFCTGLAPRAFAQDVGVFHYFQGLPEGYADPAWQGTMYFAEHLPVDSKSRIGTDRTRNFLDSTYICVGWQDGAGDIPETGDGWSTGEITHSAPSNITWLYKAAHEVTVDIAPFEQRLWSWGENSWAQLGQPLGVSSTGIPALVSGDHSDWITVSAGTYHTVAIQKDGTLWGFGRNQYGELGQPATTTRFYAPTQIGTDDDWGAASAGHEFTLALKSDGSLWSWGSDAAGKLGHGGVDSSTATPTQIGTDTDWLAVSAGYHHALALKTDGTLWAWGENDYGRLGAVDTTANTNIQAPMQVGDGADWAAVAAGGNHTIALKKDGSLWAWGHNGYGQVGAPPVITTDTWDDGVWSPVQIVAGSTWKKIANGAGSNSSLAIRSDGTLWAWGYNATNQLGLGDTDNRSTPTQVGTDSDWADVSVGGIAGAATKGNGSVWVWGGYGEVGFDLGLGTRWQISKSEPTQILSAKYGWLSVSVGTYHMVALRSHAKPATPEPSSWRKTWGWGDNSYGQLGVGQGSESAYYYPQQTSGDYADWRTISAGDTHTIAIREDGSLWAWGDNGDGKLGLGLGADAGDVFVPAQVGSGTDWAAVSAGATFTLALRGDGTIWVWGRNDYGQLGDASLASDFVQNVPRQVGGLADWVAVAAGHSHAMALKSDGTLWGWGLNSNGELGLGSMGTSALVPTQVGTDTDWSKVTTAWNHTLALKTNGALWAWGNNRYGEVGFGGFIGNDFPYELSPVLVGAGPYTFIEAGGRSSFAIRADGTLWAWGYNNDGQLGLGDWSIRYTPVPVGTSENWAAVSVNTSWEFSYEVEDSHTMAINTDGDLFAWGSQYLGRLGLGDTDGGPAPMQVEAPGDGWTAVSAGGLHTIAIRASAPTHFARFEARPHIGKRLFPADATVSSSVKVTPLEKNAAPFLLGAWQGGYGDVGETGGAMGVSFEVTQDTGLAWAYTPLTGAVAELSVAVESGLPAGIAATFGYQSTLGTWNYAQGSSIDLSAPPTVTITIPPDPDAPTEILGIPVVPEPTYEEYLCTGWVGTGSVPASGTQCSVSVILTDPASSITWLYAQDTNDEAELEVNLPDDLPDMVSENSVWVDAAADLAVQAAEVGQWQAPIALTGADHLIGQLEPGSTVKITTAYELETTGGTYKCTGLSVTEVYSDAAPVTITKNHVGDRMEILLTIPPAPPLNIQGGDSVVPLDMKVLVLYKMADLAPIGNPLALPLVAGEVWENKIDQFAAGHPAAQKSDSFFYDAANDNLYPVKPVAYFEIDGASYYSDWPAISDVSGVIEDAPVHLQPAGSGYSFKEVHYSESYDYGTWVLEDNVFHPPRPGKNLLRFSDLSGNAHFLVIEVIDFVSPASSQTWNIGSAISSSDHDDPEARNGYVYLQNAFYDGALTEMDQGDQAYVRETRTGPIIPVNKDNPDDPNDDMVVIWYQRGTVGAAAEIGWPLLVDTYDCQWPAAPPTIVVASGNGSGPLPEYKAAGKVYYQPNSEMPGYNLNEEHALLLGGSLFALQNNLNTYRTAGGAWVGPLAADETPTSEPYVLLKYQDMETSAWMMDVYRVVAQEGIVDLDGDGSLSTFTFETPAGSPILPLNPLGLLPLATESTVASGSQWHHRDHKGGHWAKAACTVGDPQCPSQIVMHWYYPLQGGFYYPDDSRHAGDAVPLLSYYEGGTSTDVADAVYATTWPGDAPRLPIGETLTTAKFGLPEVAAMAAAEVIFDENLNNGGGTLASTFAPFVARSVPLEQVAADLRTESQSGKVFFPDLPESLASRLHFDPLAEELRFQGISVDYGIGEPLLLPNILSERERDRILALDGADSRWATAVGQLFTETRAPADPAPAGAALALTAGMAAGEGYVVLAENDDPSLGAAPVQLHIIRVAGGPYQGDIKVIASDNPFDEKLTLRHSGDFAGQPERIYFKWYYKPDVNGLPPRFPVADPAADGWVAFGDEGYGVNDVTIEGAGLLTLSDNWFIVRYYYGDDPSTSVSDAGYPALTLFHPDSGPGNPDYNWSPWAGAPGGETAQLAQGWIKRVVSNLNPLDARVKDFRNNETSTEVSMVSQLGERHEGDIALNGSPENLNSIGLIEAYGTVLDRGMEFSIDSSPPADYGPANVALLNAATRISGFFTLLGNEAYADAQDPTVGWDSRTGEQGSMASSLFAFRNQLDSLLEEELVLLRGRDDSMSTTRARPVYNRLIWNFTNADGEIAYVQTYNLSDMDTSGVIDELDAKEMYPQGHGDAWGHYLTAMTTWYGLLRHGSYTWEPRIESVLVGGAPVPVDYLDERKFAETAAARARTGAEIVDLTYRRNYVADQSGQWQGYKDTDTERAWGVDEWARRAGQGAYFDWVVANAMLPSQDPNPDHTGIQKIDRSTVAGLSEIPSQYHAIQWQLDEADAGLNPLGLADGVVPFDIDPTFLEVGSGIQGGIHFDQIYERAINALQNASDAFDFANQYTLLTRGNEDELADFKVGIMEQERDFENRLIEIYGYPYSGDIGGGGTYPEGYDGPDLFRFMYMESPSLDGLPSDLVVPTATFAWEDTLYVSRFTGLADMTISDEPLSIEYPMTPDAPWAFDVPSHWGKRRAPGEIQMALSDLISANASYRQGLVELDGILAQINMSKEILRARYGVLEAQILVIDNSDTDVVTMGAVSAGLGFVRGLLDVAGDGLYDLADALAEMIPDADTAVTGKMGFITTLGALAGVEARLTNLAKGWVKVAGTVVKSGIGILSTIVGTAEDSLGVAMEASGLYRDRMLFVHDARFEVQQMVEELNTMLFEAEAKILELFTLAQAMDQSTGAFMGVLAEGERLLNERETFRKLAAGDVQEYRYQDYSFRVFRNDAVQKYRATFDLAARYAYLAATAYDYETNMLGTDAAAGQQFLAEIIRRRSPGELADGAPVAGDSGLSDPLARLEQNFGVYRTQLGINNPQLEENRFSLRRELFRIRAAAEADPAWHSELRAARVADLWQYPPFRRYCRPFTAETAEAQPGLVIPFSTEITFGRNLFGWPLGAGDSALDPSHFTTKVFGVGVSFQGYENAGLSNTPRAYLVPAGADVLRAPTDDSFVTRQWHVVDQKLPVPFPISEADFANPTLIPINDLVSDQFGGIRRQSSFRAYYDGGDAFNAAEETLDLRLVGRSVWNTQWILIIPGGAMLDDPEVGLDAFLDSVTDIQLLLSTYAFSGN